MINTYFASWFMQGGFLSQPLWLAIFFLVLIWTLVWKALALWRAARKGSEWWFIALLVLNTLGILEILYIYVFGKSDAVALPAETKTKAEGEQKQ